MIEIRHLCKSFAGVQALQDVSLLIQTGKITGLIGPNGAGKTTLFNVVTGHIAPDSGQVLYGGFSLASLAPWRVARLGVRRTFQKVRLFNKMSTLENVLLGVEHQTGEGFLNAVFTFSVKSFEHKRNHERAMHCLEIVGLHDHSSEIAENLSYGQQKLLNIACCLAGEPDVLLLDEPVAGVQPAMIGRIESILKQVMRNNLKTIFFIEHDIDFVMRMSEVVVVMDSGRIIAEGRPDAVLSNPELLEAYLS